MVGSRRSSSSLRVDSTALDCHLFRRADTGTRSKCLAAVGLLTIIGLILMLAATGCGDASPAGPDDSPVAAPTPAGSAEPVNTASGRRWHLGSRIAGRSVTN